MPFNTELTRKLGIEGTYLGPIYTPAIGQITDNCSSPGGAGWNAMGWIRRTGRGGQ